MAAGLIGTDIYVSSNCAIALHGVVAGYGVGFNRAAHGIRNIMLRGRRYVLNQLPSNAAMRMPGNPYHCNRAWRFGHNLR